MITRDCIHDDFTIEYGDEHYNKAELVSLINKAHSMLDECNIQHGEYITDVSWASPYQIAMMLAIFERGGILSQLAEFKDPYTYDFDTRLVFYAEPNDIDREGFYNIYNIVNYKETDKTFNVSKSNPIMSSKTSGTTGKPKEIIHTHTSVSAATQNASSHFYSKDDKVLMYVTLNHTGVFTVNYLAVMMTGCHAITRTNHREHAIRMFDYGANKMLFFYPTFFDVDVQDEWKNIDLSGITIITGGQMVHEQFVETLFSKNLTSLIDVYGLTECLPPLMYYDMRSVDDYKQRYITKTIDGIEKTFYKMGPLVGDTECKVKNDTLWVKGSMLGMSGSFELDDGYYDTNDYFKEIDGVFCVGGRKNSVRVKDRMVNLSLISQYARRFDSRIERVKAKVIHDEIYIGIKGCDVDKTQLNQYLTNSIDESHNVDHVLKVEAYHTGAIIKEMLQIIDDTGNTI